MTKKENYTKKIQQQLDKYKNKISRIDDLLESSNSNSKPKLLAESKNLKTKFDAAEKMLKKITTSSEDEFEKIKENAVDIFDDVKDAFHEFSSFLTMEQLYRTKDEIIDFSHEKLDEVESFVKNNPITVAACAIGMGFLIGALLTRSK